MGYSTSHAPDQQRYARREQRKWRRQDIESAMLDTREDSLCNTQDEAGFIDDTATLGSDEKGTQTSNEDTYEENGRRIKNDQSGQSKPP